MNTQSIHFRLVLWYCVTAIFISALFGFATFTTVRSKIYGEVEQLFTLRALNIARDILPPLAEGPPKMIADKIDEVFYPEASNRFFRILKPDRSVLYASGAATNGHFDPAHIPVPEGPMPRARFVELSPGDRLFIVAVPSKVAGKTFIVEAGGEADVMDNTVESLIFTQLYLVPSLVLVLAGCGLMLVRRALEPVEELRRKAGEITFGNLRNRLPEYRTGDAIEHLSVTLNQMLARLDDAYDQSSRFAADAAHELRTPLAIMHGELEALVREKALDDSLKERLFSMLEETERLTHITDVLLAMSRLDAGEAKMQEKRFDLAALARDTAEQMLLLAEEKEIRLDIDGGPPVEVRGDPARLKEVVVNILDNAIKYTPQGGRVWMRVFSQAGAAIFEVEDNGAGIPAAALPHVFDRFYRADKARSRREGGSGLGLSIAQSICHAHQGSIRMTSIEGRSTVCHVELPLAPEVDDII